MKPIIGITPSIETENKSYMVSADNIKAIIEAGGIPVILPFLTKPADIDQILQTIDGLYLTGGYDIDPILFNEEPHQQLGAITPTRDTFEMSCINKMLVLDKPILGVCRGSQILNVAVGGNMYQDIYTQHVQKDGVIKHQQSAPKGYGTHFIDVLSDSLLHRLTGERKLRVNSRHHQANKDIGGDFTVSGKARDGVVEAIESNIHPFVLGLQWHPENMAAAGDEPSLDIFKGFIKACHGRKDGDPS